MFFRHAQKPQFGLFLANPFRSFSLTLFFSFFIGGNLLPTLSSFFCVELWLANLLGKGQIQFSSSSMETAKLAVEFSPKFYLILTSVTLPGLVRIS